MTIFHFSAKIISRQSGGSAVAKAAYNSREKLRDERTDELKDYTRAEGLLFSSIYTPANVPEWAQDRERLWNAAEAAETRKDAQVAREYELSLPHELTDEQRRFLVQDFVRESFTRKGYAADVCIHSPDREGDKRNYHAHILVTDRRLEESGFAQDKKDRQQTARERKAELEALREKWEHVANRHLERHGHEARIDRRRLEEQGIDSEPTEHLGPAATAIERKGKRTERGDLNRAIKARNRAREAEPTEARTLEPQAQKNRDRQITQTEALSQQDATLERLRVHREQVERHAKRARQLTLFSSEGPIRDAQQRYDQALRHYDPRDPYGSLAQCAQDEHAALMRDRAEWDRRMAQTQDPAACRALEQKQEIEALEYLAITSERIARQSVVLTGDPHHAEAQAQRAKADAWRSQAHEARQREAQPATQEAQPLRVKAKGGEPMTLADFLRSTPEPTPPVSTARPDVVERAALLKRREGLDSLARALKAGRPLAADDLRKLKPEDREGIRQHGDAHLHEIVQAREAERRRDDYGRERER